MLYRILVLIIISNITLANDNFIKLSDEDLQAAKDLVSKANKNLNDFGLDNPLLDIEENPHKDFNLKGDNSFERILKKSLNQDNEKEDLTLPQLMIFVSFSQDKDSLKSWLEIASQKNAILVLRGFKDNSFKATANYIKNLSDKDHQGMIIAPNLYKIFEITHVPTIVMLKDDNHKCFNNSCNYTPLYDKISGEITLRYALEQFVDYGVTTKTAKSYLKQYYGEGL